jgi:predicted nucleotidyltransferase
MTNPKILNLFAQKMRDRLKPHLKELILFGSRARGDFSPDSDYDCLAVMDQISATTEDSIDELAGEFLYEHDVVFSIFTIQEDALQEWSFDPFLMNVRKEGIPI